MARTAGPPPLPRDAGVDAALPAAPGGAAPTPPGRGRGAGQALRPSAVPPAGRARGAGPKSPSGGPAAAGRPHLPPARPRPPLTWSCSPWLHVGVGLSVPPPRRPGSPLPGAGRVAPPPPTLAAPRGRRLLTAAAAAGPCRRRPRRFPASHPTPQSLFVTAAATAVARPPPPSSPAASPAASEAGASQFLRPGPPAATPAPSANQEVAGRGKGRAGALLAASPGPRGPRAGAWGGAWAGSPLPEWPEGRGERKCLPGWPTYRFVTEPGTQGAPCVLSPGPADFLSGSSPGSRATTHPKSKVIEIVPRFAVFSTPYAHGIGSLINRYCLLEPASFGGVSFRCRLRFRSSSWCSWLLPHSSCGLVTYCSLKSRAAPLLIQECSDMCTC